MILKIELPEDKLAVTGLCGVSVLRYITPASHVLPHFLRDSVGVLCALLGVVLEHGNPQCPTWNLRSSEERMRDHGWCWKGTCREHEEQLEAGLCSRGRARAPTVVTL